MLSTDKVINKVRCEEYQNNGRVVHKALNLMHNLVRHDAQERVVARVHRAPAAVGNNDTLL
jgi:hypothetical protein